MTAFCERVFNHREFSVVIWMFYPAFFHEILKCLYCVASKWTEQFFLSIKIILNWNEKNYNDYAKHALYPSIFLLCWRSDFAKHKIATHHHFEDDTTDINLTSNLVILMSQKKCFACFCISTFVEKTLQKVATFQQWQQWNTIAKTWWLRR